MTDEIMALRQMREKSADADVLRDMIGFAAQRLMDLKVGPDRGAANARLVGLPSANGERDRDWETRAGTVEELRAMHDRFGFPGLFAAYNAGPTRTKPSRTTSDPLPAGPWP